MSDLRAFFGPNAGYVLELYDRYLADPSSIDADTRAFFANFDASLPSPDGAMAAVAVQDGASIDRIVGAATLAQAIREYGHLTAKLDPLGSEPPGAPELDPATHGLTKSDLASLPARVVGGPVAEGASNAAEAVARLRNTYSGTAGFDFDHIQVADERAWLRDAVESKTYANPLEPNVKRALLRRLTQVEGFERFLHQTYLGQKRFSVEGNDILIPMLDEIVHAAAGAGSREIVFGMAHRGRLNVMTHVLGMEYRTIVAAFEGKKKQASPSQVGPADDGWTGDVKYHLGARLLRGQQGMMVEVPLVLAPNPSHLEAVNPVVEGMVRASQDVRNQPGVATRDTQGSMAILLHGDAAFPGQGIVAETLNLAALAGYTTGGTIHIIVNSQIGYTTDYTSARSTLYASDPAKGFEIPIVHVNADDPEACLMAARMANAFRERFGKDFLIDLIGYRRWGHNEGDEPAFTQPKMYETISKHPTVREVWAQRLIDEEIVTADESETLMKEALDRLAAVRRSIADGTATHVDDLPVQRERREVETAVPVDQLRTYNAVIYAVPSEFSVNSKLARPRSQRAAIFDTPDGRIDWAHAEALAFAAIISDGIPTRLSGQDTERGTFSQRHLVLHNPETGERYTPLQHLPTAKASFDVYNSPLSEQATVGLEYGYSVHAPDTLVLWEAQFGDFGNGAQITIDQFMVAARAKWRQEPSLVLLLPHGYEGQGPEHSSARLERFLQLSGNDNIRVANCTTAAQYFHLLRRQAGLLAVDPRPLVLMTPRSLLRNPAASSSIEDLASGTFMPVIDDPQAADRREQVTRLVLCSGKVAVDVDTSDQRAEAKNTAVVRVEQLAPFQNSALRTVIGQYPNLTEIAWLQEEPCNMGAWSYMEPRLRELTGGTIPIDYIGRPERASPAEGSADSHADEQARIVAGVFANVPMVTGGKDGARKAHAVKNGAVSVPGANGQHREVAKSVKTKTTKSRS